MAARQDDLKAVFDTDSYEERRWGSPALRLLKVHVHEPP